MGGKTHFKKTSVSYFLFFPTKPPLNTHRIVLMFTVYKDAMQLSLVLSPTTDKHLYKVEDLDEHDVMAVLFFKL